MKLKPVTVHVAAMVDVLSEESTRAAYMTIKRLYDLEHPLNNSIINLSSIQEKFSMEDYKL